MKVTNNQQQTAFKANAIVSFEKPLSNMEDLASSFAITELKMFSRDAGEPLKLDDTKVLVPDFSTSLGKMLRSVYYRAYNALAQICDDDALCAKRALNNPQVKEIRSLIELDKSTAKIDYKEGL